MSPSDHPSFARLTDLVEDRVDPSERGRLDSHVRACAQCAASIAWLQRAIGIMRAGALEDPPAPVINRATRLFRLRTSAQQPAASLARRILAVLSFDTGQSLGGMAFGLRTAEHAAVRQMLFTAEDHQIQLRVRFEAERWIVAGQVLGSCDDGGRAQLRGPSIVEAVLNEVCEFSLPQVPPGVYSLLVRLEGAEIEVPDLALGV